MREDFDPEIVERVKVLDKVPVPDIWSRIERTDEVGATIELEAPVWSDPVRRRARRAVAAGLVAVATAATVFISARDRETLAPSDERTPAVTVTSTTMAATTEAQPLFTGRPRELEPGTYVVDEVDGTRTAPILIAVGDGWSTPGEWVIHHGALGAALNFSRPDKVFADACQWGGAYDAGSVSTVGRLVSALHRQTGWVGVTTPVDITVDGFAGKAFERTAPTNLSGCDAGPAGLTQFRGWETAAGGLSSYSPGETEQLLVVDVAGTVVMFVTRIDDGAPEQARAELDAVLASIRIEPDASVSGSPLSAPDQASVPLDTPSPAASATSLFERGALAAGTYALAKPEGSLADYERLIFTLPAGWAMRDGVVHKRLGEADGVAFSAWTVERVHDDPCNWQESHTSELDLADDRVHDEFHAVATGSTVRKPLQGGLANQVGRNASELTSVELGGVSALRIELSVPEHLDLATCDDGQFRSWTGLGAASDANAHHVPGQIDVVYMVDVDRRTLVIDASHMPATPPSDLAELDAILASMVVDRGP